MLPALVKALQAESREVHVRVLLALGMLVGANQDLQKQLADGEGALARLLELRLQQEDDNSRHIADGIVAALVRMCSFGLPAFDACWLLLIRAMLCCAAEEP